MMHRTLLALTFAAGVLSLLSVLLVARASAAETVLVSVDSAGIQANNSSVEGKISASGRFVAFTTIASNLVVGDMNNAQDVFHHDLVTGITMRVSVDSNGVEANDLSIEPAISGSGLFVAFTSAASNLVPGDTNGTWDVFVHDVVNRTTTRVSVDTNGLEAIAPSGNPAVSESGRFVAFESAAALVSEDTNGVVDIYVRDVLLRTTTLVSIGSAGLGNGPSMFPSISADGRFIAFASDATNLVPGDMNATRDVFVHDLVTRSTIQVSVDSNGIEGNAHSGGASISADGNLVAFRSSASNLVAGDGNGVDDVFVRDIAAGTTTRVSRGVNGAEVNGHSQSPSLSPEGRFVAFYSLADNVVVGDTNGATDVFVYDRANDQTVRVSVGPNEVEGNNSSALPSISSDGRSVAFTSSATNLVERDVNGKVDIFVHRR
jgi:Tol biopolymer transport system component